MLATRADTFDAEAATNLLVAQQVRGHLVNPYLGATADLHALHLRVEIAAHRAEKILSIYNEEGELRGFTILARHHFGPSDRNGLFLGLDGLHTLEFVVPAPSEPDAEAVAIALAEAIDANCSETTTVSVPIGSGWVETFLQRSGFVVSGVESLRPAMKRLRSPKFVNNLATIREATAADVEAVTDLVVEEYAYHTPFHPIARDLFDADRYRSTFRTSISRAISDDPSATVFVADSDSGVVGMLYLRTRRIIDPTNALPGGLHVIIDDISVRANVQGRGVGRNLIEATCDAFKDESVAAYGLAYSAENPIARRLWPHLGFRAHRRSYVKSAQTR